jgi:hypothetical protein
MAVGAVDAVKVPDTYQSRAEVWRDILEFVEDLHQELLTAKDSLANFAEFSAAFAVKHSSFFT